MDEPALPARDICDDFIVPAVKRTGWGEMIRARDEVGFAKVRMIVRGKTMRSVKAKAADLAVHSRPDAPHARGGCVRRDDTPLTARPLLCLMADGEGRVKRVDRADGAGGLSLDPKTIRSLSDPVPFLAQHIRVVANVDRLMARCDGTQSGVVAIAAACRLGNALRARAPAEVPKLEAGA